MSIPWGGALYGAERSSRPKANRRKVQQVGEALEVLPITLSTAARFGVLKQQPPTWLSTSAPPRSTLALLGAWAIYRLCEDGEMSHVRINNSIRVRPKDLEKFVAAPLAVRQRTRRRRRRKRSGAG